MSIARARRPYGLLAGLVVTLAIAIWPAPAHAQSYDPCATLRVQLAQAKAMLVRAGLLNYPYGDPAAEFKASLDVDLAQERLDECVFENTPEVPPPSPYTPIVSSGPVIPWGGPWATPPGAGGAGEWIGIDCGDGRTFAAWVTGIYDAIDAAMDLCYTK